MTLAVWPNVLSPQIEHADTPPEPPRKPYCPRLPGLGQSTPDSGPLDDQPCMGNECHKRTPVHCAGE
jgi:hypothetical protein